MKIETRTIASGWAGTSETVAQIKRLVRDAQSNPSLITTARELAASVPERDKSSIIAAIHRYTQDHLHYAAERVETLSAVPYMLDQIRQRGFYVGDCDEAVTLWAALAESLRVPYRFAVISQRSDKSADHIYIQAFDGQEWVGSDPIVKHESLGWEVPNVTNKRLYMSNGHSRQVGNTAFDRMMEAAGLQGTGLGDCTCIPEKNDFNSRYARLQRFADRAYVPGMGQVIPSSSAFISSISARLAPVIGADVLKTYAAVQQAQTAAKTPAPAPSEGIPTWMYVAGIGLGLFLLSRMAK